MKERRGKIDAGAHGMTDPKDKCTGCGITSKHVRWRGDMNAFEEKLLRGYEMEKSRYQRILGLARKLSDALRSKRPVAEIVAILNDKNRILHEIESIDRSIASDKERYRLDGEKHRAVAALIDDLSSLVAQILALERENEVLYSTAGRSHKNRRDDSGLSFDRVVAKYAGGNAGEQG
jgi:hypothetical protein